MQIAVVTEDSCHTSTPLATRMMTNCQQQQQQHQRKSCQTDWQCVNKLSYQFRIVVMPHRLQMRLRLPRSAFLYSLLLLQLLAATTPPVCQAVGYSYTRFSGPVTGPEQKIIVHDGLAGGGGTRVDFIAKPAYEFAYGVEDAQARLLQNRQETRDGDAVHGSYSVVDPDGNLRVVKYTADHINGFQAEVSTNGLNTAVHGHPQLPHTAVQTHPTPTPLWYFPHVAPQQVQQVQHPNTHDNGQYDGDNRAGQGSDKEKGNYEVKDDYEEADDGEERREKQKQMDAESDENYEDEDEHEDYVNDEHSAEASEEANSYEEHSEEYY